MIPAKLVRLPGLLRSARAPFGLLVVLFGSFELRASVMVSPNPGATADAWVGSAAPNVNHNETTLTASNAKEIYLRFRLPVLGTGGVGTAPPRTVKLRLWKTSGSATTAKVYAVNNDWDEATVKWNTRPVVDGGLELASQPVASGNNVWVEFIVTAPDTPGSTAYISGAGEYSFCVRTTSAADLKFSSKEGAYAPELSIELPSDNIGNDTEFRRKASSVIVEGERYIDRYIALNGGLGSPGGNAARDDVENIGYFDVTKAPYFAKAVGDGSADSTLAIQRCINEARDARVAVYFPPTDSSAKAYLVSDTIECVQGLVDFDSQDAHGKYPGITYGERWNHRDFSCIVIGPSALQEGRFRPRLQIMGASTAFNTAPPAEHKSDADSGSKPVLRFWARGTGEGTSVPTKNYSSASYNHLVRHLDIHLNGKAGAAGIEMDGAQGTAIEKLTINANGAYAGITGLPGPGGGTTDVTIQGGIYGVTAYSPNSSAYTVLLTHCTLLDDTNSGHQKKSVRWSGLGPMVLVGCKIQGKGIQIDGSGTGGTPGAGGAGWRGNMSIVDSTIELTGAGGPAVSGSRSLYLRNVYLKNVTPIANITTTSGDAGSVNRPSGISASQWFLVPEYHEGAHLDQYAGQGSYPDDGLPAEITPGFINPTSSTDARLTAAAPGLPTTSQAPAANFLDRHAMPDVPMWDAANVINVKTWSGTKALGDNTANDAPAIREAIDAAHAAGTGQVVFIPRGEYSLNGTLWLKPGTVLFGLHKNLSRLKASGDSGSTFMNGDPKPLVQSPTGAGAATVLADLMLLQRMNTPKAYLLDWQAGAGSVVQNINFDRRIVGSGAIIDFALVRISGNGGGRWYNFQHQGSAHQNEDPGSNYRHLLVSGTTQALKFYMLNPETDSNNIYNVEIKDSSNIDVFQSKFEGRHSPSVRLSNSSDLRWIGVGGNAYTDVSKAFISVVNCSNYLISSLANQANFLSGATPATDFNRLKEIMTTPPPGTVSPITLPGQKQAVVYRRGQPIDND